MTTRTIRTVGDLIDRLQEFNRDMPIRTADSIHGTSDKSEFVFAVSLLPPANDAVAVWHLDPNAEYSP